MRTPEQERDILLTTYEVAKEHHLHLIRLLSDNSQILSETRKKISDLIGEEETRKILGLK